MANYNICIYLLIHIIVCSSHIPDKRLRQNIDLHKNSDVLDTQHAPIGKLISLFIVGPYIIKYGPCGTTKSSQSKP